VISETGDDRRSGRLLIWGLALSIAIHALLAAFSSWVLLAKLPLFAPKPQPREIVISSTAVRIERRRPVPRPRSRAVPQTRPEPVEPPQTARRPQPATRAAPPATRPHELARAAPTAQPQPSPAKIERSRPSTLEQQIAAQQRTFQQEVARLHAADNPLSIAPKARETPSTLHRTYFDVAGRRDLDAVQVQLVPIQRWVTGTMVCYYARYVAQYTHGGNEEGTVPWPVCYPLGDDRIANPPYVHDIPIPVPQPDYVLPPGTYLTPLLTRIYGQRRIR
jgi:hypothetical protein